MRHLRYTSREGRGEQRRELEATGEETERGEARRRKKRKNKKIKTKERGDGGAVTFPHSTKI